MPGATPEPVTDPYLIHERSGGRFGLFERRDFKLVLIALLGSETSADNLAERIAQRIRAHVFVAERATNESKVFEARAAFGPTSRREEGV